MAEIVDDFHDDTEDFGHQGCYIFRPSISSSHDVDDRPKKKRKTAKDVFSTIDAWPRLCGGAESLELANLRRKTFRSLWSEHEERIARVANKVDNNVLRDVGDFIQSDDGSAGGLKTGLIISGPDSHAQNHVLDYLKETHESSPNVLIQLQSSQAPNLQTALKNIIRTAIEAHSDQEGYTSFLSSHKRLLPLNFDLELLQEYISQNQIQKIIVSIQDAETFDNGILAELLSSLSSWTHRIPFVALLGIATTIDLFENRLSKSTIRLLSARAFDLTSNQEDKIYQLFCAIQCSLHPGPYLGSSTINTLLELTQDQSNTTSAFIRALKYTYMSCFFANPLSVLLSPHIPDSSDVGSLCEAIRNTPSFQIHCSSILKQGESHIEMVRQLLNNDPFLITQSQTAIKLGVENLHHVNEQIQVIVTLYKYLIATRESWLALHLQLQQSLSSPSNTLIDTEIYITLIEALKELPSNDLMSLSLTFPDVFSNIDPSGGVSKLSMSISKLEKKYSEASIRSTHLISYSMSAGHSNSTSNSAFTQAEMEYTAILDAFVTSLDTYLTSTSSSSSNNNNYYYNTSSTHLRPTSIFLSEAFLHNARSPLHSTFLPRPRFALERALRVPRDYLGCECCADTPPDNREAGVKRQGAGAGKIRTREASSVMFNLLDEAGREVNVRDLWDAFLNVMVPNAAAGMGDVSPSDVGGDGRTDEDLEEDAEAAAAAAAEERGRDDSQVEDTSAEDLRHKGQRKGKGKSKGARKRKPTEPQNNTAETASDLVPKAKSKPQQHSLNGTPLPNQPENTEQDQMRNPDGQLEEEREEPSPDRDQETQVLALFYTALAELKMLGLIKSSSSSTTTGTNSSLRGKGVDVISRTIWSGL